jgi:hypothetical protein
MEFENWQDIDREEKEAEFITEESYQLEKLEE